MLFYSLYHDLPNLCIAHLFSPFQQEAHRRFRPCRRTGYRVSFPARVADSEKQSRAGDSSLFSQIILYIPEKILASFSNICYAFITADSAFCGTLPEAPEIKALN